MTEDTTATTEVFDTADYAGDAAPSPQAPAAIKKDALDDISVMSRIKTLMNKLPAEHQVRVAKWTADRWG